MTTTADFATALQALGVRDVTVRGDHIVTLGSVLAGAQRLRLDAVHVSVVLDAVAPRPGCTWRPICFLCADGLDVALGREVEAHRINGDTRHDTGCCSFCEYGGEDTLVASIGDDVFAAPPAEFLALRRAYADGGHEILR